MIHEAGKTLRFSDASTHTDLHLSSKIRFSNKWMGSRVQCTSVGFVYLTEQAQPGRPSPSIWTATASRTQEFPQTHGVSM